MKKIIVALFLILSLVICLPACNENQTVAENPKFEGFNAMFRQSFSNYVIEITTQSANDYSVSEKYTVTTDENGERSVAYRIEQLNAFEIGENGVIIPNDYKSVSEGVYDSSKSANTRFNVPAFKFSYTCLSKSDVIIGNSYSTEITSLQKFMGVDIAVTNARVNLYYTGNTVKSIEISYVTDAGNNVVLTYTFN